MDELMKQYRDAAAAAAEASAEIAIFEERKANAQMRYEAAKALRDRLKREIASQGAKIRCL